MTACDKVARGGDGFESADMETLLHSGARVVSQALLLRRQTLIESLHETFHLARQGGYSDEQMAKAACTLANVPPPNFLPNQIAAWSSTMSAPFTTS